VRMSIVIVGSRMGRAGTFAPRLKPLYRFAFQNPPGPRRPFAEPSRTSAVIMGPRLVQMFLADPSVITTAHNVIARVYAASCRPTSRRQGGWQPDVR
jgi:hypothetical protein